MVNKKYAIEIEVLTPINIGAGSEKEWKKGVDFVEKDDKIYILNIRKIAEKGIELDSLASCFARRDDKGVANLLGNNLDDVSDKVFQKPARTSNDIKSFIKNELSDMPIIPGSSLKGAIRSILFKHLKNASLKIDDKIEKAVFGSATDGDEFMRFIKISDFMFAETELVNTKIFNLYQKDNHWEGGWKHAFRGQGATTNQFKSTGFNTIYETIALNSKGVGNIMLAEISFDNLLKHQTTKNSQRKKEILNIDNLFKVINAHTLNYLQKERDFFQKYSTEKSDQIIESIDALIAQIPDNNAYCVLKMAVGSGFHSITGDWQFDDYSSSVTRPKKNKRYKSRKIAINNDAFTLMGFVKISKISVEDKKKAEETIHRKHRERIEEKIRLKKEREEEQKRVAEEKAKAEREAKERSEKYEKLIQEGSNAYEKELWEEALKKFEEAAETLKDGGKHNAKIIDIKQRLTKMQEEAMAAKRLEEKIENRLAFLDEKYSDEERYKVNDFKGLTNRVNQWMRQAKKENAEQLTENDYVALINALKRIYEASNNWDKKNNNDINKGVWKHVINWVGEEQAKIIFDKVIK